MFKSLVTFVCIFAAFSIMVLDAAPAENQTCVDPEVWSCFWCGLYGESKCLYQSPPTGPMHICDGSQRACDYHCQCKDGYYRDRFGSNKCVLKEKCTPEHSTI